MAKGLLEFEAGAVQYPWEELQDAGDGMTFESANAPWSVQGDVPTQVKPYGILTGARARPGDAADTVHIPAQSLAMPGSPAADDDGVVTIAAQDVTITRGTAPDTYIVNAVTVDQAGDVVVLQGSPHTAFDDSHGENGGPPFIPEGSVMVTQVRTSSADSAVLAGSEVLTVDGLHREMSAWPIYKQPNEAEGSVSFNSELPRIHAGGKPKKVFAIYATPIFQELPDTTDYTPAETTHSSSSTATHQDPRGVESSGLSDASFSVILDDGISEPLLRQKNKRIWFKWRPNMARDLPYQLTLGRLAVSRSNPASGDRTASCTIAVQRASVDVTE